MGYKSLLIYNPAAGPWDMRRPLKNLAGYLERYGWHMELVETQKAGDATEFARQAALQGTDLVLAAGGDGTINEVVNGVVGSNTMMSIVPVGTGNILARQLRMPILSVAAPFYVSETGDALLKGHVQKVDTGKANGRSFICWAGVGLDAEIANYLEPRPKYIKHMRTIPYIISAFSVASEFKGVKAKLSMEGRALNARALLILASNIQLYAAFFTIARHAYMDDGMLDIFIFKGLGWPYALRHILYVFSGRYLRDPGIIQVLTRNLEIRTLPDVALQVDGEPIGATPVSISLDAASLSLLVPSQAPGDLFCKPPERVL
ncbi:MAG: diacylglycerol kinase family lipid kinase [Anaerolineae bacterium]|jgi:YegS/Rv2252/BmrU family lipid kinase|nr:diacylglycerol kinase family lipid kinase [Anaerolineae bacterium]